MATLPISKFLTQRLSEFDPKFELRSGTGFESLFFQPMEFMVQPFRDEASEVFVGQSFLRILLTDNPDSFAEEYVDALAANLFVSRVQGSKTSGVVRVYFNAPVDREYAATGALFTSGSGNTYSNPAPYSITAAQMSLQIENGLYYLDIPVESESTGSAQSVDPAGIVTLANDSEYVSCTNKLAFSGGTDRETNTNFILRVQNSIGVRDLVADKGFHAVLFANFPDTLTEVQPIGFGDDEMMRDIVYNIHVGGRVDGYCKTAELATGYLNVTGLLIDETRQTPTSTNVKLVGTNLVTLGNQTVDRTGGKAPIVQEIKISKYAYYVSPVPMGSALNLSNAQYAKIGIDGVFKNVRLSGVSSAATTRNEIINLINAAFGVTVAYPSGSTIMIKSPVAGILSAVSLGSPDAGTSALFPVFGLSDSGSPYQYVGGGPVTFLEGVNYNIDDANGLIHRIVGPVIKTQQTSGTTTASQTVFSDPTANAFVNVQLRDVLSIVTGADAGDYRVLGKTDDNHLILDHALTATGSVSYLITRTGIKSGEIVYVQYHYNPLSVDIGSLIPLDQYGRTRGVRPGRSAVTITDGPVVRIRSIEEIDPLTLEPTGVVLDGDGGFGRGGYGQGGFGVGQAVDYHVVVNTPETRFSMFDDSYIVFNSGLSGLSFRINYDYAPSIADYHNFVRAGSERVLDGDILIKHFIPAFVSGTIKYHIDPSVLTSVPPVSIVLEGIRKFINNIKAGQPLDYSDITQFLVRTMDPYDRYGVYVKSYKLEATVHNTDGSLLKLTGVDQLAITAPNPFPRYTTAPLSPRISHWIADAIVLEQV